MRQHGFYFPVAGRIGEFLTLLAQDGHRGHFLQNLGLNRGAQDRAEKIRGTARLDAALEKPRPVAAKHEGRDVLETPVTERRHDPLAEEGLVTHPRRRTVLRKVEIAERALHELAEQGRCDSHLERALGDRERVEALGFRPRGRRRLHGGVATVAPFAPFAVSVSEVNDPARLAAANYLTNQRSKAAHDDSPWAVAHARRPNNSATERDATGNDRYGGSNRIRHERPNLNATMPPPSFATMASPTF